jgi:hypothetical protein
MSWFVSLKWTDLVMVMLLVKVMRIHDTGLQTLQSSILSLNTSILSVHGPGLPSVQLHFEPPLLTLMRIRTQLAIMHVHIRFGCIKADHSISLRFRVGGFVSHNVKRPSLSSAGPGSGSKWATRPEKKVKNFMFEVLNLMFDVLFWELDASPVPILDLLLGCLGINKLQFLQCGGFLPIPDPGSPMKDIGEKNLLSYLFL